MTRMNARQAVAMWQGLEKQAQFDQNIDPREAQTIRNASPYGQAIHKARGEGNLQEADRLVEEYANRFTGGNTQAALYDLRLVGGAPPAPQ